MSEAEVETKDVAAKAKTMGHVSKEDWKGDPAQWRPAEEFVERGEQILPIMQKRLDEVENELKMSLKMNDRRDKKIADDEYKRATAEYDKKLVALDKKEMKAFDDADSETYVEVKQERADLEKPEKPVADAKPEVNPAFVDWSKQNSWYADDTDLREYADMFGDKLIKGKPGIAEDKLYEEVTEQVRKMFPDRFKNPNRENAQSVEGGDASPSSSGKNSFDDLPSTAKAAFKKLAAKAKAAGREYTKAAYTEAYYE